MKKFKIGDKVRFKKEILDKSNLLKDKTEVYTICNIINVTEDDVRYELKEDDDVSYGTKFLFDLIDVKVEKEHSYPAKILELVPDKPLTADKPLFSLVSFGTVINVLNSTKCGSCYFSRENSRLKITNKRIEDTDVLVTIGGKLYNPSYEDIFAKDWYQVEVK